MKTCKTSKAKLLAATCLLASFASVFFLAQTSAAYATASLQGDSAIDRSQVLVGDLFTNAGRLAAEPVGTAPAPGQRNVYDVTALSRVARAYNIDWQPSQLDARIVITRSSSKINNAQISQSIINALAEKQQGYNRVLVTLDRKGFELDLPSEFGTADLSFNNVNYNTHSHRFSGTLTAHSDKGSNPLSFQLTGRAVPQIDVPVVARRVEAGQAIAESDLDYVSMPADRVTSDTIRSAAALVGKEMRRGLSQGSVISDRDLRPLQLVRRGNMVTIIIESGGMRVTARGKAMSDGGSGDMVRVMNTQSNRIVEGRINARGEVAVPLNS